MTLSNLVQRPMAETIDTLGDKDLLAALSAAEVEDLVVLVDHITDSGKGRLALACEVKAALLDAKARGKFSSGALQLLVREIQHFGGNSVVNLFRRNGVSYTEIVRDVLEHLGGKPASDESAQSMELRVLELLVSTAWEKMDATARADFVKSLGGEASGFSQGALLAAIRRGGPVSLKAALLVSASFSAPGLAGIVGAGSSIIAGRAAGALLGPVAVAMSGVWGAYSLTSQAYRITVPCVVQIAYIRQKQSLKACPSCQASNILTSKFCSECGAGLGL